MDWNITIFFRFMISYCRFCTSCEMHDQCMWFGNLSYFPAALTLYQTAAAWQNKSDPSTLLKWGRHITIPLMTLNLLNMKKFLLNVLLSLSSRNIFFSWINEVLLWFLKVPYFIWPHATLWSAGRVVRASELLLTVLPAAGRLSK